MEGLVQGNVEKTKFIIDSTKMNQKEKQLPHENES